MNKKAKVLLIVVIVFIISGGAFYFLSKDSNQSNNDDKNEITNNETNTNEENNTNETEETPEVETTDFKRIKGCWEASDGTNFNVCFTTPSKWSYNGAESTFKIDGVAEYEGEISYVISSDDKYYHFNYANDEVSFIGEISKPTEQNSPGAGYNYLNGFKELKKTK